MIEHAKQLYALPPSEFTAERNRLAKSLKAEGRADEAAMVGGLRRPRLAEYALNRVANDDHALIKRVVEAAQRASEAQSAAIGGAATSLRQVTADLRAATKELVDSAVRALNADGASGEAQRDEIAELLRDLLTSTGSAQLLEGVVGLEGFEVSDEIFPGAPEPPPARREAPAKARTRAATTTSTTRPARSNVEPRETARTKHRDMQAERTRLTKGRRDAWAAVDDAERELATAVKDVERAQRKADAAQERLEAAEVAASKADEALDDFERSLRD